MGFIKGFKSVFRGMSIIKTHKLWSFLIMPTGICLVLMGASFYALQLGGNELVALSATLDGLLGDITGYAIRFFQYAFYILFLVYVFPIILRLLVVPFLGQLSEATEVALTGAPLPDPPVGFWKATGQSIHIGVRMGITETVVLLILGLIPSGIGQVIVFLVGSYYLGSGFFDLILERKVRTVAEREDWFGKYRSTLAGQGAAVRLLSLLPVLGVLMGMAGATAGAVEIFLVEEEAIPS